MSFKKKYYKKNRNVLIIILGLLLIFIIGYAFWNESKNKTKSLENDEKQPDSLDKLQALLIEKQDEKLSLETQIENQVFRRNTLFIYTRLTLVLLTVGCFLLLQFVWTPIMFKNAYWIDNLRNFITTIVLGFTTIAFITKGNLKSFKESIEGMAIKWFFRAEANLKAEILMLDEKIHYLTDKIMQFELANKIHENELAFLNENSLGKDDVSELPQKS